MYMTTSSESNAQTSGNAENVENNTGFSQASSAVSVHDNSSVISIKEADNQSQTNEQNAMKWFWSDGVEGAGEAPEWFDSKKYKSVEDQAKGMKGMRKILGDFTGAPKDYKVEISDEIKSKGIEVDVESPLYKQFTELAKQSQLSQEGFDKIVNMYLQNVVEEMPDSEEIQAAYEEEIKAIGGEEKLEELNAWGKNNLPEDLYHVFRDKIVTAEDAKLFMHIRDKMTRSQIPANAHTQTITNDDLLKMHADPRMKSDVNFQKMVMSKYRQFYNITK